RGQGRFDVRRAGHDHRAEHVVFPDPGETMISPFDLPRRPYGVDPVQHRVLLTARAVPVRDLALVPEGFVDPRVRRQIEGLGPGGMASMPRHVAAGGVEPAEGAQEALPVVLAAYE